MRLVVPGAASLLIGLLIFPTHARTETVLSYYAGKAWTADATVTLEEPGSRLEFGKVSWSDESFTSPIYYGIRATHWLGATTGWGVGLDFIHIKMFAGLEDSVAVSGTREGAGVSDTERLGDTFSTLSFSHGHNLLLATGFYRWVPAHGDSWLSRLHPYVGLGLGVSIPHVEVDVAGSSTDEYQVSGPAFQGLAGLEIVVFSRLRGLLEYKLTHAHIGADLTGGASLTVNPWTHQFTFGVSAVLLN